MNLILKVFRPIASSKFNFAMTFTRKKGRQITAPMAAACQSPIYCNGTLLSTIQSSGIFSDSKDFVDMKMKKTVYETIQEFYSLMAYNEDEPSREALKMFVDDHFESEDELEDWYPTDFNPEPRFLHRIRNPDIKDFARRIVWLWPKLGRKLKARVWKDHEKYSMIPLRNGFILPCGNFREAYYWDTYWIMNGLLISEMYETARGLLDNFVYMVKIYGFVPNGSRIYYAQRSQPPLFVPMAAKYIQYTNDIEWLRKNILFLKREVKYWRRQRLVKILKADQEDFHRLAYYGHDSYGPRPESYHEDIDLASHLEIDEEREEIFANVKSAVQSGWDFSSRWIYDDKYPTNIALSQTKYIIPVDLNAILYLIYQSMSYLYGMLNNHERKIYWWQTAEKLKASITEMLWCEDDHMWYDYNMKTNRHNRRFYASNIAPLWTGAYPIKKPNTYGKDSAIYLKRHGALEFPGGVPASLEPTGLRWDYPNAWPPIQALVVQGLHWSGDEEAVQLAKDIATRWVYSTMKGYTETGMMYEKYDCVDAGSYGAIDEGYILSTGSGWTNGITLEFIVKYFTS